MSFSEEYSERINYPLAAILEVFTNDFGEVTGAVIKKGKTGKDSKVHISQLIPFLEVNASCNDTIVEGDNSSKSEISSVKVPSCPRKKSSSFGWGKDTEYVKSKLNCDIEENFYIKNFPLPLGTMLDNYFLSILLLNLL